MEKTIENLVRESGLTDGELATWLREKGWRVEKPPTYAEQLADRMNREDRSVDVAIPIMSEPRPATVAAVVLGISGETVDDERKVFVRIDGGFRSSVFTVQDLWPIVVHSDSDGDIIITVTLPGIAMSGEVR